MAKQFRTTLVVDGDARGGIRAVHATRDEIRQLDAANERASRNSRTAAATMQRSYSGIQATIASARTAAVGLGGALVLRKTISDFADFERGLIGVGKTTDMVGDELEALGEDIQEMSRRVPVATTELLEIAQSAGQLGVEGRDNILRFTETVAKLGSASDLAGEEGATAFARLLTVTGEPIENVDRLGAAVVEMGNNYAATESQITKVAQRVAQSTAQFDVGASNVLGISTALQAVGVEAEAGGTQIGLAFQTINEAIRGGGAAMERLQDITGQTGDELREAFQGGRSAEVFQAFIEGLGRVRKSGGDVTAVLDDMGLTGVRASQVFGTLATRSDLLGQAIADANRGWDENIALNKEAAVAAESFSAQMQLVQNAADEASAELGRMIAPALLDGMTAARELFIDLSENMDTVMAAGGAVAAVFAGRVVSSLAAATQASFASRAAAIDQARADNLAAEAARRHAAAQVLTSEAAVNRARYQAALARGTTNQAAALKALDVAQRQAVQSRLALTQATNAASAANANYARTAGIAAAAARGLGSAVAFLGGPVGVAVLAAGAIYSFRDELGLTSRPAEDLKRRVDELTGALDDNTASADENSRAWIDNRISKIQADMVETTTQIEKSTAALDKFNASLRSGAPASPWAEFNEQAFGEGDRLRGLERERDAQEKAIAELKQRRADLDSALRGENGTGSSSGAAGAAVGDQAIASLLNQYDSATVKLKELRAARQKILSARESADPDNLHRYNAALAEIDRQIEQVTAGHKKARRALTDQQKAAKQLQQTYEQTAGDYARQIALFDETGEAAQVRYDTERGALRDLDAAQKQNLMRMAQQVDQLSAQKSAVQSLFPEWQKLQQASQLRRSVADLPENMQAFGRRRAGQLAAEAATEGLPGMQGLDPQYNGAFGEADRLEDERAEYEQQYQQRLEAFREYAQAHEDEQASVNAAIEALQTDHQQRMLQYDEQTQRARRQGYAATFSEITDLVGTFAGEQSAIYKSMFAASKAFAIADSVIQIQNALAKAANVPFPANLAAMGTVAAQTASILSNINSVTLSGQAHDGSSALPSDGTYYMQGGERVIDRRANQDFTRWLARENRTTNNNSDSRSTTIHMPITVQAQPGVSDEDAQRQGRQIGAQLKPVVQSVIRDEMRSGGILQNVKAG